MTTVDRLTSALLELAREHLHREPQAQPASGVSLTTPFNNTTQADWAEAVALWNHHGRAFLTKMRPRSCPTCGADRRRALFESYDGYPFVECESCKCWYVPLVVEAEVFERFFAACPEAREVSARTFAKRSSPENVAVDLERIGGYLETLLPLLPDGNGGRYLDVGCGLGHSLQAASRLGLAGTGVESSTECIEIGQRNGLDVRPVEALRADERFALVSFWESLEHIGDPGAALRSAASVLEADGLVALTVPNQLSPLVRAQRADCAFVNGGFDTAGHINLFSPANLEQLLARNGLTLLDIDCQYGMNLLELASYAVGGHRGAADLLAGNPVDGGLPPAAAEVLTSIGPAVSLIERLALLSPILFAVACRRESAGHLTAPIAELRRLRHGRIAAQAEALMPPLSNEEELRAKLAAAEAELRETHERLVRSDQEYLQIRRALKALRDPIGTLARIVGRK
ncbi:MAG: class I SAM-dependent methyltransferase [Betaproteobacteria bacterium]|nr:class I SAM-dependent methyltransferase [Betaproteobacteria bacterium]